MIQAYSVPYALKNEVGRQLKQLQSQNGIFPVHHSDWASPVVAVPKNIDITLNKVLNADHHPLPRIDDVFATLGGGKLEVPEQYQHLLTINTHLELFHFKRLAYGVTSAPALLHVFMDKIIGYMPMVTCYLDYILVAGYGEEDCKQNVKEVLKRLNIYRVQLNVEKCLYLVISVDYLGHIIDAEGTHPTRAKTESVLKMPVPANLKQLKSYVGLINFYGKFIPNI
ncbi:hypothetical protein PR048_001675 [Dryococelus australis]|uniref:Reverse transcriptase domain-containing protein n=1 Tax=Dryococelus australis TaxID=614101 RepID=A0ABQ9IJ32_9NEOP|nr:hypothetical protein PR048_001675 [Dryococelus australis]